MCHLKFILLFLILLPFTAQAQADIKKDAFFKAEVIAILEEKVNTLPDGSEVIQQNILLNGLEGEYKNKEMKFNGIGGFDVIGNNIYQAGDKVLVVESFDAEGNSAFYITDYIRTHSILWLVIIFLLLYFNFKNITEALS